MSYGIGPHDYDCDCWRCQSRRKPEPEPIEVAPGGDLQESANFSRVRIAYLDKSSYYIQQVGASYVVKNQGAKIVAMRPDEESANRCVELLNAAILSEAAK